MRCIVVLVYTCLVATLAMAEEFENCHIDRALDGRYHAVSTVESLVAIGLGQNLALYTNASGTSLERRGSYPCPGDICWGGVQLVTFDTQTLAFVACKERCLICVDVTGPGEPQLLDRFDTECLAMSAIDNLIVLRSEANLELLTFSLEHGFQSQSVIQDESWFKSALLLDSQHLIVCGDTLSAGSAYARGYDVSDPVAPVMLANSSIPDFCFCDVAARGENCFYLGLRDNDCVRGWLHRFEWSGTDSIELTNSVEMESFISDVLAIDDLLVMSNGLRRLDSVSLEQLDLMAIQGVDLEPTEGGLLLGSGSSLRLLQDVDGVLNEVDHVWALYQIRCITQLDEMTILLRSVSGSNTYLFLLDLGNSESELQLVEAPVGMRVHIQQYGDYLIAWDGDSLQAYRHETPGQIEAIGTLPFWGACSVFDNQLAVSSSTGIDVYNLAASLEQMCSLDLEGDFATSLAYRDDGLLFACGSDSYYFFDTSDPVNVHEYPSMDSGWRYYLQHMDNALVSYGYGGFRVYGVELEEDAIVLEEWLSQAMEANADLFAAAERILVKANELLVYGLDESHELVELARYASPHLQLHKPLSDGRILLSGIGDCVLLQLDQDVSVPCVPAIKTDWHLQSVYPNPFNAATSIPVRLDQTQNVQLQIYDLLGRRVATLLDGTLPAGEHTLRWQADSFPSACYIIQLQGHDLQETRQVLLLK